MEEEMSAQKALNNIMTQICLGMRAKSAVSDRVVPEERIKANTFPKDPLKKSAPLSQSILQKSRPNTSTSGTRIRINANMFVSPQEFCGYPRADERKNSRTI
uniref:Uncharacterized protein n=1 Tax=Timema tahoe TaxID=61484 RepID=A0A7R9P168_9NEOP|nr:unnamed protein product [Timema tahoe]